MKKMLVLCAAGASVASALPATVLAADILGRVISSTPVVQQVAVQRQVCNNQVVVAEAPKSGAGALLGAMAGGAAGNAIGNGNGRALATMIGLVGGVIVGNNIESRSEQARAVQQCTTQTVYENRASHYSVVYEYQGTQYNVQMANDPGQYVRLQVTPIGAASVPPQTGFVIQPQPQPQPQSQPQPQPYTQPNVQPYIYQPPQSYAPQNALPYGYVHQAARQLLPAATHTVAYPAPHNTTRGHGGVVHMAPAHHSGAPIGLSLSFGYSNSNSNSNGHNRNPNWR